MLEDDQRFPTATFDLLESIPVLPEDLDGQHMANVQVKVLEIGELAGGERPKKIIRVCNAAAAEEESPSGLVLSSGWVL